ncbi:LytR/AlgR family response regulator transcription factor, partial [Bacteroidota bacterium]
MPDNINCLIVDDERVAREILENHLSKIGSMHLTGSCKNALEAFNIINSQHIDLIFLDIISSLLNNNTNYYICIKNDYA